MSFTRTLRAVGGVAMAGALLFSAAPIATADQIRDSQWPLTAFSADKIWKVSTGKGVTVAVIDNPVYGQHADLKGNVLTGKSFINGGPGDVPWEKQDHGTAMASLIAGHGHGPAGADGVKGLAPDAKILPASINLSDSLKVGRTMDWAPALRYAVDHHAQVVNMSFVAGEPTPEDKAAVSYARQHDVLLVGGAGNTGSDDPPQYPGSMPGVVEVGAVDPTLKVWKFSSYGSHLMLTAPGVDIRSAGVADPYHKADGTSDATAYVSAAAALLRSKFPNLTAGQIVNRLVKTTTLPADKKGIKLPDEHYGYGIIRPLRALTENIPAGSKDGPLPPVSKSSSGSGSEAGSSPGADGGSENAKLPSHRAISPGAVIGIVAGVVVVLVLVVVVVVVARRKKGRSGPPPGGPGGWGGPGGPGGPGPGGYVPPQAQQYPGQPNPYQSGYGGQTPPQYQPPTNAPQYPPQAPPQQ